MADASDTAKAAAAPDVPDVLSTDETAPSSMFANYGDESPDQLSLGEYERLNCAAERLSCT